MTTTTASASDAEQAPIFLLGHARSGVGLLTQLLTLHSQVSCVPQTGLLDLLDSARWQTITQTDGWPERALETLTARGDDASSLAVALGLDPDDIRLELATRKPSVQAVLETMTVAHARGQGKARWVVPSSRHLLHVRDIRGLWPAARLVRIVRDPRAVVASLAARPAAGAGPTSAVGRAYAWRAADDPTWRFFERDAGSITIRYEDLLGDPEGQLTRLVDFIGVPFEAAMSDPLSVDARETDRLARRRTLSVPDQHRVALICGNGLTRLGYQDSRRPAAEAWVKPLDAAFIADAESLLIQATDAGVVLRMSVMHWPSERGPLLLWGAEGQLRWGGAGRAASARAVARWGRSLAKARLRGRPALWVRRPTERPVRPTLTERAADALARRLTVATDAERVLDLLVETPRARGRQTKGRPWRS